MSDTETVVDFASHSADRSAEQKARLIKEHAVKILGDLVELDREAQKESFTIEFNLQRDQLGRLYFIGPQVSKRF